MSFLGFVLVIIILTVLWSLRPLVATGITLIAFYAGELLHKKKADHIIRVINRQPNEQDAVLLLKSYRRHFIDLKVFGLLLLIGYSLATAWVGWVLFHSVLLLRMMFFGTALLNWTWFVTNIPIRFLAWHEERMPKSKLEDWEHDMWAEAARTADAIEAEVVEVKPKKQKKLVQ